MEAIPKARYSKKSLLPDEQYKTGRQIKRKTESKVKKKTYKQIIYDARQIKEAYSLALTGTVDQLEVWIKRVAEENPAMAVQLVTRLSEFIIPKLKAEEHKVEITQAMDYSLLSNEELETLLSLTSKCQKNLI